MASESVPLAIVGIGCLFPKAVGPGAFWANIKQGIDCVGPVPATHWKPEEYFDADPKSPDMTYAARGAFLDPVDFNPLEFGISPVDLEATDTSQLLGLIAARQALNDAGYTPEKKYDKNRISVILGVTGTLELVIPLGARLGHPKWRKALAEAGVDQETADRVVSDISDSYVPWQENSFPGLLGNVVAGRIANKLDLGGTNCVVDAACASSLSAIHLAGLELVAGRCDVAVTGGVDTFNDIFMYMCFSKTPALSRTGDAKPFDANGDGTILGEGLGIIVLKRLADAERDGDRIYAVLKAIGTSSDGKGNAVYAPTVHGQVRCLQNAYEQAGVSPATIELIEAHGTGTKVGDSVEATALSQVFRDSKRDGTWCALGSVKSMIGHTKAAAGAAGIIKATLALYNKVLPPTIKVQQPVEPLEPGKSPVYVNTEKRPWLPNRDHPRRAGMSAFGFGGSNFHAVLEEYKPAKLAPDWDGQTQIVAFSGESKAQLLQQLSAWPSTNSWGEFCNAAARSRASFDGNAICRLLFVLQEPESQAKVFAAAKAKLESEPNARSWSLPAAYFGSGPASGKIGVLFPGQGSQRVGMLRDLACSFPAMLDSLSEAEKVWNNPKRLIDFIYPHSSFTAESRAANETSLRATEIAQPALGAVNLGAWRTLQHFGITASAFAGHSYGELVALCAAGAYSPTELHDLSRERGGLMASIQGNDAGTMLAAMAPLAEIEQVLKEENLALVIANRNSPTQNVLSGSTTEIERAETLFRKRNLRCTRLPVAAGFHSPLVARAKRPFQACLESVEIREKSVPVYANLNARKYPDCIDDTREWLAEQLVQPVEFVKLIENMAGDGIRTFIEVGPGSVLTRLTEATLAVKPEFADCDCFAIDASSGKKSGLLDLANMLARLAARGHAVDLCTWGAGQNYPVSQAKAGLTVPITGANYVRPKPVKPKPPAKEAIASVPQPERPPQRTLMNEPIQKPPEPSPTGMSAALSITQQSLLAFQRMQEETAKLHKQFLENQHSALATLHALVAQQQALLMGQPMPPVTWVQNSASAPPISVPQSVAQKPAPDAWVQNSASAPPILEQKRSSVPARIDEKQHSIPTGKDTSSILLSVVAEKTGYPADMLGLDMALDADLGIDSIKRVEILSALQERIPDAPAAKPEHLGTLHTLRDIVNFLGGTQDRPNTVAEAKPAAAEPKPTSQSNIAETLLAVVAEKTGYPADMLGLDMALDADLGIDSIKRVEILSALQERIPDAPAAKPEHLGTLHTLRDIATFLSSNATIAPVLEAPRPFELALTHGSAESERVPEQTISVEHSEVPVVPELPAPANSRVVRKCIRTVPIDLELSRPRVRFDTFAPVWLIGNASSFAAKLLQQFDAVGCKPQLISWNDTASSYDPKGLAGLVLLAPDEAGPSDLPLRAIRWLKRAAPALEESARSSGAFFATITNLDGMFGFGPLDAASDPIHGGLAGLSKTASHEWPKIACKAIDIDPNVLSDVPQILVEEILTAGPLEVGLHARGRVALQLADIPAVLPAGEACLLSERDVVIVTGGARGVTAESLLPLVRESKPRLVLLGRTPLPGKEPDWLVNRTGESQIKAAVIANTGKALTPRQIGEECRRITAQREILHNIKRLSEAGATVEYLAIDVQNAAALTPALADVRRRLGPIAALVHGAGVIADRRIEDLTEEQFLNVYDTKVVGLRNLLAATEDDPLKAIVLFSSSTGRFGRTGQVAYAVANEVLNKTAQILSRSKLHCRVVALNWGPWDGGMVTPALAKLFEKEGLGLIPLAEGGETLLRELSSGDRPAEVVILAEPIGAIESVPATAPPTTGPGLAQTFERRITLADHPVLRSHVIGEKSVVPFVLHVEWMAHAAMHGHPGLKFHGFDDLHIFQGIHVEEANATTIQVLSGKAIRKDGLFQVPVEIRGKKNDREVTHSRGEIVLAERLPDSAFASAPPETGPFPYTPEEVYEYILFHGPDLRALGRIDGMGDIGAIAYTQSAPSPIMWMNAPVRGAWLADPLALDAAFQLLSVWSYQKHRAVSLPCFVGRYRQFRRAFPTDGALIFARITRDNGTTARAEVDFIDADGRTVARMTDVEHVIDASLNEAFRRGRIHSPTGTGTIATQIGSRLR